MGDQILERELGICEEVGLEKPSAFEGCCDNGASPCDEERFPVDGRHGVHIAVSLTSRASGVTVVMISVPPKCAFLHVYLHHPVWVSCLETPDSSGLGSPARTPRWSDSPGRV